MSLTSYSSLYPTGDVVEYNNAKVEYPASNVVDTFGQIWVSKVHGYEMNALEVASAGKISFTPSNEHSLDLLLDDGQASVKLRARNDNSLVLENEDSSGRLTLADDGSALVSALGGGSLLQMDTSGNLFQAGGSGDNRYVVPTARTHCFTVGTTEVLCVEEDGASVSNLTVNGTDFRVPVGAVGARPAGTEGQIYYNSTANRFEGFASGAWSGLGGTIDVDQDTYVSAETSPNADNDQLLFVTAGTERLRIDSDGQVGYGTTNPQFDLDWKGDAEFTTDDGNVLRVDGSGFFVGSASGSNRFSVQAGQDHAFDVGASQIASIDSAGMTTVNLTVDGTSFLVPRGPQASRPAGTDGQIFYNEDTGRFEGYASAAWGGLGGTVDVDQNTYISAEDNPGDDNNELKFVTAGEERMRITDAGLLGYGTSNPEYTFDIVGDLRVSGSLIANNTVIGDTGTVMELGVQPDGSSDVVDGLDTNDGSGLTVVGVPDASLFTSAYKDRFEKSLRWNFNESGMMNLGQKDAWDTESFWKLRGGAFHLSHTNADSGAETEFIMRCNEKDELQFVRHIKPVDGHAETYDVIARFGNTNPGTGAVRYAGERGYAVLDADLTSMNTALSNVDAFVESFSTYDDYVVYGALFPVGETPDSSEVIAAASNYGYISDALAAATDNTTQFTFSNLFDGSAVPNTIVKFAAVTQQVSDGSVSSTPHISFVLNDESIFDQLVITVGQQTQTYIIYNISFGSLTWNDLSAADQVIFQAWLEQQVTQAAEAQGIQVQSLELNFVSGSIIATATVFFPTEDTSRVLTNALSDDSTAVLNNPEKTPVPFADREPVTITRNDVTTEVVEVVRLQSAPSIVSVAETASTENSITVSYEVAEANQNNSVVKLYALATTSPLASPILPGNIKGNANKETFTVTGTTGSATIAIDASERTYIYFVAENDAAPTPVLSPEFRIISEPFTVLMPSSIPISGATGYHQIAAQDGTDNALATETGIAAYSSASSATGHLLLYEDGDANIPATASDAKTQVDGGATSSSVGLS